MGIVKPLTCPHCKGKIESVIVQMPDGSVATVPIKDMAKYLDKGKIKNIPIPKVIKYRG